MHTQRYTSYYQRVAPMFVALFTTVAIAAPAAASPFIWGPGSWCWFGDPRAVHIGGPTGQTLAGWLDPKGRVMIGSYDEETGGYRSLAIDQMPVDDHSNPSLLVEPDNRITAFYSGHNGAALYYRTTIRPRDITAWGPRQQLEGNLAGDKGYTYPNPQVLSAEGNRLYLFWRSGNWNPAYEVRTRTGVWSSPTQLVDAPGQRPYVKVDSNSKDTIALAFTNAHPREQLTSIYYAGYSAGFLRHANGRPIVAMGSRAIKPGEADVVYDARRSGVGAWVYDVALDQANRPVIVYETLPRSGQHLYWYARWNGRAWDRHFMVDGGPSISPGTLETGYAGGIALDHANPAVVYLSRPIGGNFQIERWTTANDGATWTREQITHARGVDNVRPVVPRGDEGELLWLRGRYGSYTSYSTEIALARLGDNPYGLSAGPEQLAGSRSGLGHRS